MNSVKTKNKNYSLVKGKAIAGVVLIPCNGHFMAYVAWEWQNQADKKHFAIIESPHIIGNDVIDSETINNIADYGNDVTDDISIRKHFPNLF